MRIRSIPIALAAALLAACTPNETVAPSLSTHSGSMLQRGAKTAVRADHGRSWMKSDARRKELLYISDQGTQDVYVFSYPQGALIGTLTGFNEPSGECSDKTGNVFIANAFANNVLEYAHGGKSPIATLSEPGQFPSGCSVDSSSGNLAVTTYCSGSGCTAPGSVLVYANETGTPTQYQDAHISNFAFCGYDNKGNLFIDGSNGSKFAFAELPAGKTTLKNITLNQSIGKPGNVQWDGTYVAVGDNTAGVIYQFTVNGKTGTKAGTTTLTGSNDVVQFWLQSPNAIGPNAGSANVKYWRYPSGGSPTKTINGLTTPIGATVSL